MRLARFIVALGCIVVAGCRDLHVHLGGRYYEGREAETVLLETPDVVVQQQENALRRAGPWSDGDLSDVVP